MDRDELIEAARAAFTAAWDAEDRQGRTAHHNRSRAGIVAALTVFEEADSLTVPSVNVTDPHSSSVSVSDTPTNDDRELDFRRARESWMAKNPALHKYHEYYSSWDKGFDAGYDAAVRRSVSPEPSAEQTPGHCVSAACPVATRHAFHEQVFEVRSEPQAEPSDAQVRAACQAWAANEWRIAPAEAMRAALRAATAVTQQGENGARS